MWTSTSKVIQSNEVQKEKIQLETIAFPTRIDYEEVTLVICDDLVERSQETIAFPPFSLLYL
jgi:hypothetical protein